MDFYWLLIGVLCVWRITHLVQAEDGPWDIMVLFRRAVGNGVFGKMLDCFQCSSLWIAIPFAWWTGSGTVHGILLWLAFSAGAILLERLTSRAPSIPPALYTEDLYTNDKE